MGMDATHNTNNGDEKMNVVFGLTMCGIVGSCVIGIIMELASVVQASLNAVGL
jgi:hypothetical protein